jgi:hypothetical protein
LSVSENKALSIVSGPKSEKVRVKWVKEDKMGRACSTHGRHEEYIYIEFWWESQKERDH